MILGCKSGCVMRLSTCKDPNLWNLSRTPNTWFNHFPTSQWARAPLMDWLLAVNKGARQQAAYPLQQSGSPCPSRSGSGHLSSASGASKERSRKRPWAVWWRQAGELDTWNRMLETGRKHSKGEGHLTEKAKPPLKHSPHHFQDPSSPEYMGENKCWLFPPRVPSILKCKQLLFLDSNTATPVGEPRGKDKAEQSWLLFRYGKAQRGQGQFGAFWSTLTLVGGIRLNLCTSYISWN